MHDSQDGAVVTPGAPVPHLLKKDCVGCHGGAGAATIDGAGTPIVASAAMPSYPPDGSAS
ncbi:hypothetical protein G3N55_10595, partial [Dissulfurirhabdus thermomarina]|nr:hypothetical protein [Dissulfurirhabdus thermomarina]